MSDRSDGLVLFLCRRGNWKEIRGKSLYCCLLMLRFERDSDAYYIVSCECRVILRGVRN